MWIITKKKHEYVLGLARRQKKAMRESFESQIRDGTTKLQEAERVLHSTEREKVLADLETALNLIQEYQRVLSQMSASDPNIIKANALLEKWGKKGDPNATYLGAQQRVPSWSGNESIRDEFSTVIPPKTRWEREEEEYGDEAYGSGNVRIEAEAIDEGDEKEPGFTRAHIRFVDLDEEPEALTAAKEAGWSPQES